MNIFNTKFDSINWVKLSFSKNTDLILCNQTTLFVKINFTLHLNKLSVRNIFCVKVKDFPRAKKKEFIV